MSVFVCVCEHKCQCLFASVSSNGKCLFASVSTSVTVSVSTSVKVSVHL